ncbi:uridine kinase [bacterium]
MQKQYKTNIKSNIAPAKTVASIILKEFTTSKQPIIIAIGGPGGTGKSSFANKLTTYLKDSGILTLDDYKTSRKFRKTKNLHGPHPNANDINLILKHLAAIKESQSIDKPIYNRKTGIADSTEEFQAKHFIILDGEISTYETFHKFVDFSIFIDSDWKTQLKTRIERDIEKRGYDKEKAITTFLNSNIKEFNEFGKKSKNRADIHLFCKSNYRLVIDSVSKSIYEKYKSKLNKKVNPFIKILDIPIRYLLQLNLYYTRKLLKKTKDSN